MKKTKTEASFFLDAVRGVNIIYPTMKKKTEKNKEAQVCEDCGRKTSKGKRIMFTDRYLDETYDLWFCNECAKKYKGGKNI